MVWERWNGLIWKDPHPACWPTCVRKILESLHFLSNLCTWTSFGRLLPSHLKPKFRNEVPLISIIFDTLGDGELWLVTARKRSLRQDNVFTPVCHSVHRGGVGFPACITGHITRGLCRGGGQSASRESVCIGGGGGGGYIQGSWADCRLWSASGMHGILECILVQIELEQERDRDQCYVERLV